MRKGLAVPARIILVTGEPGVGKTTVLVRTMDIVKAKGYTFGGMISKEVRQGLERKGFELLDIGSERKGTLAWLSGIGPRIGKYRVNLKDLAEIGAKSLLDAVKNSDVILCDEVGPMELHSPEFRRALSEAMSSKKPLIASIHHTLQDRSISNLKSSPEAEIVEVTLENRDEVSRLLASKLLALLEG